MESITRRNFLKAGAAATAVCMGSIGTAMALDEIEWAYEADVVVVGFGGAGAAAAINAADAGASVILLEKAPEKYAGGNTGVCGGGWRTIVEGKEELAVQFFMAEMPRHGEFTSEEEIRGYVEELCGTSAWMESLGVKLGQPGKGGNVYPGLYGSESIGGRVMCADGMGSALFMHLRDAVEDRDDLITVFYETPGDGLIYDYQTKEVFGVKAIENGQSINIKAKKGVILTLGGFEGSPEILCQYVQPGADFIYPTGTPYNTGDGLRWIMEIGAKPRHFGTVEWSAWNALVPSRQYGVGFSFAGMELAFNHGIMVNGDGKRFFNETAYSGTYPYPVHCHAQMEVFDFSYDKVGYANVPFFLVCDSVKMAEGPLVANARLDSTQNWAGIFAADYHPWSDDNQEEVELGYILKADTITELAEKMGVDANALQETVDHWNAMVEQGADADFGRDKQITPINEPPYYACEIGVSLINTQGGPKRDGQHRVLDWNDNPIPRLYAGGEFGSVYGWLYQGGGNVPEALGARVAGTNCAALEPWA